MVACLWTSFCDAINSLPDHGKSFVLENLKINNHFVNDLDGKITRIIIRVICTFKLTTTYGYYKWIKLLIFF